MNTFALIGLFLTSVNADSVCGSGQRFMTALVCKNGKTFLHCAPNNLKDRSEFCANPNLKWSEAKCRRHGGYDRLDVDNTGCYTSSFLAMTYGVSYDFCGENIEIIKHEPVNLGFESGDLNGWSVSGATPPRVVCDNFSPEGRCHAELTTRGTTPRTQPNKLERSDLLVTNPGGCNGVDQEVRFWYNFIAGDFLPFNDRLTININGDDGFSSKTVVDVAQVGDFGSSGWTRVTVQIGQVPAGTRLAVSISAEITNAVDGAFSSLAYLDDVSIGKSPVALSIEHAMGSRANAGMISQANNCNKAEIIMPIVLLTSLLTTITMIMT